MTKPSFLLAGRVALGLAGSLGVLWLLGFHLRRNAFTGVILSLVMTTSSLCCLKFLELQALFLLFLCCPTFFLLCYYRLPGRPEPAQRH